CKARFPREYVKESVVDESGHLSMKKHDIWSNRVNPLISYLFGCNTDLTEMLSGTIVKAIIIYITDYITKSSIKFSSTFSALKDV
ncbi:hypothetical protein BCR33DRAFT_641590, partial [Rhizoclosmatium globosum]